MTGISRRIVLAGLGASPLAMPGIIRAQSTSKPIKIGLLSDMSGPYRDVGGPGNRVAAELAVQDNGGSVLDRPIQILQADDQNKPDVASSIARAWIDEEDVVALLDGAASSASLAIQQVAKEKKRPYLATSPATSDLTGKQCSPFGIQFVYDTYALSHGTGSALTKAGGKTWFFITADYAFGHALERDTTAAVKEAGGKVLGGVKAPLGTADFSSYLIQAASSGAEVIGLANAGTDLQNCIKQSAEFGLTKGGTRMATLLMAINDVVSLGQKTCEGLVYTDSFYWDMNDGTRAFAKRWGEKFNGMVPGLLHAGNYCAVNHWMKCVKAIGTTDA
ncbi:MAG: ABC transporter substrate-binding protein, partial [Acetobacteraceae bacterium]